MSNNDDQGRWNLQGLAACFNNACKIELGSSPNGSVNTFTTASSSGGLCGRINFLGSDGDEFLPTARIEGTVDGTLGIEPDGLYATLTVQAFDRAPTHRQLWECWHWRNRNASDGSLQVIRYLAPRSPTNSI